ncbi:MAG: hypothetical protein IJD30_03770 [Clostridia bacterium]|nr:hypothetical protein [Clostridia bacterium]
MWGGVRCGYQIGVVGNDALSDFDAIEEIVNIFEEFGVSAGDRHDFG